MHWQEAVNKSQVEIAKRIGKKGNVYYRYKHGFCMKFFSNKIAPIEAKNHEIEGYLDWEPVSPKD